MMKFIMFLVMLIFIFNMFNKFILQLMYQNLVFILMFMFLFNFPLNNLNYWVKMYYFFGCDFYSMGLILLSFWILSLMVLMSEMFLVKLNYYYYINILNFLLIFLIMCFLTMNLILFYMFFESSLIPVFMLIMGWGHQVDRIQAGMYMMIYTMLGSFPLLIIIIFIYMSENLLMLDLLEMSILNWYFYIMMIIAFLIKMPMYFLHLWLPKAHVEAPLIGSMVLAGLMLKLGSYGLMRVLLIMINMSVYFNKFIIIISLMGGIYSSLICLCQIDMKMLVAYSSIVHMSILMSGLLTMFNWGYLGSMNLMIAHGLCSSGLFCLVNINYERLESRSLLINKGMINFFPSLSLIWFLLCSSNLSFPPSLNLFSEIMLFNSIISWSVNLMILLMIMLFFSAFYSLYLYSYSQHGNFNFNIHYIKSIKINEFVVLLLHWLPLNMMFLMIYMFI